MNDLHIYSVFSHDDCNDYELRWYGGHDLQIHCERTKNQLGHIQGDPNYSSMKNLAKDMFGDLASIKKAIEMTRWCK